MLLSSCGSNAPGEVLGHYEVMAKLASNTCGSGTGATNPWLFYIELSREGPTLHWSWQRDGSPLVSGPIDAQRHAELRETRTDTAGSGKLACSLKRDGALTFQLAEGAAPKSFAGTITYTFSIADGSCGAALTASGGPYDTLPCAMTYDVAGKRH